MNTSSLLLLTITQLLRLAQSFMSTFPNHPQTSLHARPEAISNAVHKTILTRRTINNFEPTLPPNYETALQKAIEAGIYAPNHKRTEPWRFYLLGPEAISKVCQLNADIISASKGFEAGQKKYKRWMDIPGWLVVTCTISEEDMNNPTSAAREDYAACCCAVQNICLSLKAQGIGTKWTTGAVNFDERFANAVGFDYGREYTVGTVWFGKAVGCEPMAPGKKFEVHDVLKKVD